LSRVLVVPPRLGRVCVVGRLRVGRPTRWVRGHARELSAGGPRGFGPRSLIGVSIYSREIKLVMISCK
jgi:hypothetical protein